MHQKMSHQEFQSQAVERIFSEDSILQLVKDLANAFGGSKSTNYLGVYEGLLTKKPQKDLDHKYVLAMCIRNAGGDQSRTAKLMSLIGGLSGIEQGREIVQFLALMGKRVENEKSEEKLSHFSIPKEMLDGSLFNKLPREDVPMTLYRSQFAFDAAPGTDLPMMSKFLHPEKQSSGKKLKAKQNEINVSAEDKDVDWEAVAKMGPLPSRRTWETLGRLDPPQEKPLLTEVVPSWNLPCKLSRKKFSAHLAYLAAGIPSESFPFSEEMKSFVLNKNLLVEGISPEAIASLVKPIIAYGTSHYHLNNFSNSNERSLIVQAIQRSVRHLLLLYRRSVDNQVQGLGERLLAVVHSLQWVGPPLVAVSAFCTPPAGKRLKGLVALEKLNSMCSQLNSGRTACVFLALLRAAAEAYLRTLWAWLFEGRLPDDKKAAEFFIQAQPATLGRRDHAFWADSFLVLENRVPTFLKGLENDIKQCGIALSFLKLYKQNHPLMNLKKRPDVVCCLNDAELERFRAQCAEYEQSTIEVCGPFVTAAEQLKINQEEQQAFLAMVAKVREERLVEIRAAQKLEREQAEARRRKLQQELAQQIEECKARKAEQLRKEREDEKRIEHELQELQERQQKFIEEEKERLRRHFDERSKDPEQRLVQTNAEIQSLRDELDGTKVSEDSGTGVQPTPDEEAPPLPEEPKTEEQVVDNFTIETVDDENKNPTSTMEIDEPDANANVSPLKTPTQLSIMPMDNSAALAASQNRARVLGHEFNLIQNMDECDSAPKKNLASPLDNEQLFETVRMRSIEAARNRAKIMQNEFFALDCPAVPHPVPDTPDSPEVSAMSISTDESPMEPPPKPFPISSSSHSMTSLMSLLSEPRRWVSESSRESVNALIKENGPDTHSKAGFLRLTASVVIRTQLRLANSCVLHVFLSELSVLGHLASLRRFFLLMDGEFAARLTADLCTEAERCRDAPETLLNFATLQMLLQAALSRSEDPNRHRLSLGVRSVPQRLDPSDGRFLDCVQLQYETAWPLNCVLTTRVLSDYERLFTFLLNLRRTVWTLERCFRLLQTGVGRRLLARSPQHRTLSLHLFEMAAFFRAFHAYVHNVAIVQQWPKCEAALHSVSSFDELRQLHSRLFLKNVVFRCLLRPEAAQIQQLLSGTIRPVLRFHALLSSHPWTLQNDVYTHPQFERLTLEYRKYHERTNILTKNLSKLATRGYQSDLHDLCDYLRMNDFYSVLTSEPIPSSTVSASSTSSSLKSR